MCSQPPRNVDDGWLLDEIATCVSLLDPAPPSITFTAESRFWIGDALFPYSLVCRRSFQPPKFILSQTGGSLPIRELRTHGSNWIALIPKSIARAC